MAARARSAQTQLRVGRLTKAHGLKGALKLELFTDDPERRFVPGASFALQVPASSPWHGRRLELAELRWYNGQPVGFFAGVADRSAAETLVKAILWVDQDPEEPAEPDAWYDHQLVGLDVERDGEKVGVIDRLEHLPAQDLLVVVTGDPSTGPEERREVLVPFVKALVPEVDVASRRVVVTPPEGLFEPLPDEDERGGPAESDVREVDAAAGAPSDREDLPSADGALQAASARVDASGTADGSDPDAASDGSSVDDAATPSGAADRSAADDAAGGGAAAGAVPPSEGSASAGAAPDEGSGEPEADAPPAAGPAPDGSSTSEAESGDEGASPRD